MRLTLGISTDVNSLPSRNGGVDGVQATSESVDSRIVVQERNVGGGLESGCIWASVRAR